MSTFCILLTWLNMEKNYDKYDILKLQRACNDKFGPYKVELDVEHFTLKAFKTYETDLLTIVLSINSSQLVKNK